MTILALLTILASSTAQINPIDSELLDKCMSNKYISTNINEIMTGLARRESWAIVRYPDLFVGQTVTVCGKIQRYEGDVNRWQIITGQAEVIFTYNCKGRPLRVLNGGCVEGLIRRRDGLSYEEATVSTQQEVIISQDCSLSEPLPN